MTTVARKTELAASTDIPAALNLGLAAFYILVNLYQFIVLPLYLLPAGSWWAFTLLPLVVLNNPFWSLIHEAIHDLFHPARTINLGWGRLLSVLFGSPFRVLRMSHLLHHKLNRTAAEGTEFYDREKTSFLKASPGYYFQIFGGLYLVEFLSPVFFLLPRPWLRGIKERFVKPDSVSSILVQNWLGDEALREIRLDGAIIMAWIGLSLYCYGDTWPILAALLAARGFMISFLDNVYHYRTPVNDIFYAANLRLPGALAGTLLFFNLHGIHHRNPSIPWKRLPDAFRAGSQTFQQNYFVAAAAQLCGPVALQDLPRSTPR